MRALTPVFTLLLATTMLSGCHQGAGPALDIPGIGLGAQATYAFDGTLAGFGLGLGAGMEIDGVRVFPTTGRLQVTATETESFTPFGLRREGLQLNYTFMRGADELFLGAQVLNATLGVEGRIVDGTISQGGKEQAAWIHSWDYTGSDLLLANVVAGRGWDDGPFVFENPELNRSWQGQARVGRSEVTVRVAGGSGQPDYFGTWGPECPFPAKFVVTAANGRSLLKLDLLDCRLGSSPRTGSLADRDLAMPTKSPFLKDAGRGFWVHPEASVGGPTVGDAWQRLVNDPQFNVHCQGTCQLVEAIGSQTSKARNILQPGPFQVFQWGFIVNGASCRLFVVSYWAPGDVEIQSRDATNCAFHAFTALDLAALQDSTDHLVTEFGAAVLGVRLETAGGAYLTMHPGTLDQVAANSAQANIALSWLVARQGRLSSFVTSTPAL